MANGERRAIADVEVGDEVLATDPATGKTSARSVTATQVMLHDGDLLDLTIEDDDGRGVIQTTDNHPFWSVTDGGWEAAIELSVGEQLRQDDGSTATVVKLTERPGRQDMWDLTVEVDHNFYVDYGHGAVLVHNQDAGKNHPHGDGGRALTKAEEQMAELEKQLQDPNLSRKEKVKIRNKIQNIRQNAQQAAKGETHSRRAKGC